MFLSHGPIGYTVMDIKLTVHNRQKNQTKNKIKTKKQNENKTKQNNNSNHNVMGLSAACL